MTQTPSRKFKIIHVSEVELSRVEEEGACGAWIRWLISKKDGAPNFSMRLFEIDPEGRTPLHTHSWEHEVFILEGKCKVIIEGEEKEVGPWTVIYIPPNVEHTFINIGSEKLKFLCLIPHK